LIFPLRQNIGFALKPDMPYRGAQIITLNVRNAIAALLDSDGLLMRKRFKDLGWTFIAAI
jgi:hypothetical protein